MLRCSCCLSFAYRCHCLGWCLNPQVKESRETEIAINENRNKYRTVAARGAMLFFLLNSLNKIHAFYQFSLNAFVTVFSRGLDHAPGGRKKKGPRRSASLKDAVSCSLLALLLPPPWPLSLPSSMTP